MQICFQASIASFFPTILQQETSNDFNCNTLLNCNAQLFHLEIALQKRLSPHFWSRVVPVGIFRLQKSDSVARCSIKGMGGCCGKLNPNQRL